MIFKEESPDCPDSPVWGWRWHLRQAVRFRLILLVLLRLRAEGPCQNNHRDYGDKHSESGTKTWLRGTCCSLDRVCCGGGVQDGDGGKTYTSLILLSWHKSSKESDVCFWKWYHMTCWIMFSLPHLSHWPLSSPFSSINPFFSGCLYKALFSATGMINGLDR